jgi:hypothetical protein
VGGDNLESNQSCTCTQALTIPLAEPEMSSWLCTLIETRWRCIKWHLKLVCGLWWCFLVCINVNTQVIALRHWRSAVHLNRLKQYLTLAVAENMLHASRNITRDEQINTFLCDKAVTVWKFHNSHVWLIRKYTVYLSESGNESVKSG